MLMMVPEQVYVGAWDITDLVIGNNDATDALTSAVGMERIIGGGY